jgi:3-oxoacyl-(acyl-carrier-protein) synthase
MVFPNTVMNTMAAAASIAVGAKGASVTLNQQTVAGELAVARAAAMVASGRMQAVLAGGVDEIAPTLYRMLSKLRALSPMNDGPEGCWPFDRRHNGRVLGEGATFVLLEPLENALERGATIYAELRGAAWGNSPGGAHRRGSSANGNGSVITRALAQAELPLEAIGWAYLSGNGDPALDDWQLKRVNAAFTAHQPRLTSLTPLAGDHAGLGALRVAAATWTTRSGRVPSISSLRDPVSSDCAFATGSQHCSAKGPGLVHGVARGGTEVALVISSVDT